MFNNAFAQFAMHDYTGYATKYAAAMKGCNDTRDALHKAVSRFFPSICSIS
jgi:hypothetical protein